MNNRVFNHIGVRPASEIILDLDTMTLRCEKTSLDKLQTSSSSSVLKIFMYGMEWKTQIMIEVSYLK